MGRKKAIERQARRRERGYVGQTYFNMDALDGAGIELWRAKEKENFIAIIPPEDKEVYFGFEIFAHFNVGFDDANFLCPRMMAKKRCPLCEEYRQRKADGTDDEKLMRMLNPYPPRYLFWIVDMKDTETEAQGVQLYDAPMTVNDEITAMSKDKRTGEYLDVSDPIDGFVVCFTRVGTGIRTRYKAFELENRDPLPKEWLEQVGEFEDFVVIPTYEQIKEAYEGEPADEQAEHEDAPRTVRRVGRMGRPEEAEPEEEEAPRPSRKPRRGSTREVLDGVEKEVDETRRPKRRRQEEDDDEGEQEEDRLAETKRRLKGTIAKRRERQDADDEERPRTRRRRKQEDDDDEGEPFG